MHPQTSLEFLLVSSNYETLSAVSGGLKEWGAAFGFAPSAESARDYIGRRKVDGIFVDLDVPGSRDLILSIRQGVANRDAVVFACVPPSKESPVALVSGASYLLQKPLTVDAVLSHLTVAQGVMYRERRRFFRYAANIPVFVTTDGADQRAMVTNIGEGGMAVRVIKPLSCPMMIDFHFELPSGPRIAGKGLVAWAHNEGMVGVKFQLLRGEGKIHLQKWLSDHQPEIPQPVGVVQGH